LERHLAIPPIPCYDNSITKEAGKRMNIRTFVAAGRVFSNLEYIKGYAFIISGTWGKSAHLPQSRPIRLLVETY